MNDGPRFIIIGFPRSGSTSANRHLSKHPNVEVLSQLNFFNKDNDEPRRWIKGYNSGINEYKKYFIPGGSSSKRNLPKNNKKKIIGERTVDYIYERNGLPILRIKKHFPNIKLIILMREPISRAYSQYNKFFLEKQTSINDFYKWVETLDEDPSKYDIWLKNVFDLFPRKNIHITIAEQVLENPLEEYNKIFKFIGAKPLKKINFDSSINKKSYKKELSLDTFKKLYNYYKKNIDETYKLLGFTIPEWEIKYKNMDII